MIVRAFVFMICGIAMICFIGESICVERRDECLIRSGYAMGLPLSKKASFEGGRLIECGGAIIMPKFAFRPISIGS